LGIKDYVSTNVKENDIIEKSPLYEVITVNGGTGTGLAKSPSSSTVRKSRTNFVTSEGYDP
jgi:hypothetical protein